MAKKTDDMPVLDHMEELRRVLIVSVVSTLALAIVAYFFCDRILAILLEPVTNAGHNLNFIRVTDPIFVKLKLSLFVGFLASMPIILWQVWSFIVPALKRNERVYFTLFVLLSFIFFIAGVAFAFLGVYHLGIAFLLRFAGPELIPMLTIDKYISFTVAFVLPFGIVFELPLVAFILARLEIIKYNFLAKNRRYAVLIIVVLAASITPPDIITCLLVSGPMYLLFELSTQIVRLVERSIARKKARQELAENI